MNKIREVSNFPGSPGRTGTVTYSFPFCFRNVTIERNDNDNIIWVWYRTKSVCTGIAWEFFCDNVFKMPYHNTRSITMDYLFSKILWSNRCMEVIKWKVIKDDCVGRYIYIFYSYNACIIHHDDDDCFCLLSSRKCCI